MNTFRLWPAGLASFCQNTNKNRIYRAQLTNCPEALTNVKIRDGIDEFLKDLKICQCLS